MKETKAEMLSRKNAEIAVLQARIRGIKTRLEPLSRQSNCTIAIKEIMAEADLAIDQAKSMYQADAYG